MIIQSPTIKTQPVPIIAPKPIVKKFQSDSVFAYCLFGLMLTCKSPPLSEDNEKHETMSKYSNNLEKGSNFVQLYYSLK